MARMWVKFLALAAWTGMAVSTAQAGDITFWTWRQEDRAAYTALFAQFTQENPSIHVKFEAFAAENYNTIVSAALAGGRGADVLHVRAYGGLEQFAKAGYLVPLDTTMVPELLNLSADALKSESLRADGKVYAVSSASQTLGILINKDIFAKAGVSIPRDWVSFLAACKTLKSSGVTPIANGSATGWMDEVFTGLFTNPMLGRAWVDDLVSGKTTFADTPYVGALGHLLELRPFMPDGFTGVDYATAQQLFLSGRAAMFAGGSFEIANFRKQNPKLNIDFIAPPAPNAGGPQPVTVYFDGGYAANAKSPNQADALKLVRWMGTKEYGDKFEALLGNISPIKGVTSDDALLNKVSALNDVAMPYVMLAYFRFETPTGSELLQSGVQKMMSDTATPQQVGTDVTTGIAHYYPPFQKK